MLHEQLKGFTKRRYTWLGLIKKQIFQLTCEEFHCHYYVSEIKPLIENGKYVYRSSPPKKGFAELRLKRHRKIREIDP